MRHINATVTTAMALSSLLLLGCQQETTQTNQAVATTLATTPVVGTHTATESTYNAFNLNRAIKNSQAVIDKVKEELGYTATEGSSKDQEGRPEGFGIDSFQALVDEAKTLLDTNAPAEKIHQTVVDLIRWQYFYTSFQASLPPTPLLESGDKIITPPEGTHPFYTKYMNVYVDDYRHGSPIITSDKVPDEAIYKVRETMLKLMNRKDIRMALADQNIRVVLRGSAEQNSDHPGTIGPGGAVPGQPTTYIEEEGVYWRDADGKPHEAFARLGRHVAVEEFVHSIHSSAIPYIEPGRDIMGEIDDAFRTAVRNGYYDPAPHSGKNLLTDPERAEELAMLLDENLDLTLLMSAEDAPPGMEAYVGLDFRPVEYFAVGLDLMYGIPHENMEYKLTSVEEMKEKDPKLYKILTDLFVDDGWSPYNTGNMGEDLP